jgi:L-arabinose isomerase
MAARTIRPRVGVLALTLELYETLLPELRSGRQEWLERAALPMLRAVADVSFSRAVFRPEDVEALVAEYEAAGVDALVVICLTYCPSQIALGALRRTRLPIVIWNTQELLSVGDDFDGGQMVANHGVHGTQDLASVLVQHGVQFEYFTSHPSDAGGVGPLADFLVAAAAVAGLRRVRVGLMGYPFPGMGDFAVDTTHLAATLGCQWTSLSVEEYIQRADAARPDDVRQLCQEYRRLYAVADDLTDADLGATAAAELAMRGIVADRKLDAFSYQFLAFGEDERTMTLPFVAASRMMADGVGFAGEGDLIGAVGTWLLDRLQGPASFSEVFTIDFAGNGLFMSHMGEANVAMAMVGRKIPLVARPQPITRTRGRQLALVTSFRPGPATLFALCRGPEQQWRLIASPMQIADYGPLPGMCVPHFKLTCGEGDVRGFLTSYAKAGGPHHNAVCFGDATRRLRFAAKMLDADYCEIRGAVWHTHARLPRGKA